MEALYQPGDVKGQVLWSSSDPLTASVSADGLVTAQRKGVTAIVARGEGCAAACVITVLPREAEVERITLNKTAVTLQTTDRIQLQAALEPAGLSLIHIFQAAAHRSSTAPSQGASASSWAGRSFTPPYTPIAARL